MFCLLDHLFSIILYIKEIIMFEPTNDFEITYRLDLEETIR